MRIGFKSDTKYGVDSSAWGNIVLLLVIMTTMLDILFHNDVRHSGIEFASNRLLAHGLKMLSLFIMVIYLLKYYKFPRYRFLKLFESTLWCIVGIIAIHLVLQIRTGYQLGTVFRCYYWIFIYFFFRQTICFIPNLNKKIYILILLLMIQAIRTFVLDWQYRHELGVFSTNSAYYFQYALLMILCFCKNKKLKILLTFILIGVIYFTLKRSAIISNTAVLLILIISYYRLGHQVFPLKVALIAILSGLVILLFIQDQLYERFDSIFSGNDARNWLYEESYDRWDNADNIHWLFGHGFYDTPFYLQEIKRGIYQTRDSLRPIHSHSDLFQFMPDMGLVGLLVLIMLHTALVLIVLDCWVHEKQQTHLIMVFYALYFFKALLSGSFWDIDMGYLFLCLAAIFSSLDNSCSNSTNDCKRPENHVLALES